MNKVVSAAFCAVTISAFSACQSISDREFNKAKKAAQDNHDYHTLSNAEVVKASHLDLDIAVDFDQKTIQGAAEWTLDQHTSNEVVFDTRDLVIDSIILDDGAKAKFNLSPANDILGAGLHVTITPTTKKVKIYYKTHPGASALQWLSPEQTFGKKHPFLYTQSESIHARSWIPAQDGPGIRYTYSAQVKVPKGLMAIMSAQNPQEVSADGVYSFEMEHPVPAYLMALAVGDIAFKEIDPRTGVYAEPAILEKAYNEFSGIGKFVDVAEDLYGPYRWGRYDVLVLPSGFPIGGMENPRLTFCTPTLLAGDKSLVNVIAHELAHNWSGNLVTNQSWNDFWLNEGFTVYFERRIMEAIEGKDYADMLWEIGYQDLELIVNDFGDKSPDTHLRLALKDRNPDEGLTDVPYEKGALLLRLIEQTVGRAQFDVFLRNYFDEHAFQTMNTQSFVDYLNDKLIKGNKSWIKAIDINKWLYGPGIPQNAPKADHKRFDAVDQQFAQYVQSFDVTKLNTTNWSTFEWMHFLRQLLEKTVSVEQLVAFDQQFNMTKGRNSEIDDLWYQIAIKNHYAPAFDAMTAFLNVTGRQKFLEPLYKAMMKTSEGKKQAQGIYKNARPNYHPLTQKLIDEIVK